VRSVVEAALQQEHVPERIAVSGELPDDVWLQVDPAQVQSALGNVIRNAIEAMPETGALSIRATTDGDRVLIVIHDDGSGVSEENVGRLFDPLVTTKPLGIGLGLSTARNLIENREAASAIRERPARAPSSPSSCRPRAAEVAAAPPTPSSSTRSVLA